MYGYDIPRYAREKDAEIKRYDRFLRIRWSLDVPGAFIVERKTRYLTDHPFRRGTDKQVQLKDEYRTILRLWPNQLKDLMGFLKRADIQRTGAKQLANELDAMDDRDREREERARRDEFEALGSEAFDFLAWREGRRVAV